MDYLMWLVVVFLSYISGGSAYTICYRQGLFGFDTRITCSYGCCGTYSSRYCCPRPYLPSAFSTGATAGIIIGIFTFVAVILLVSICYKKKYYGRVVGAGRVNQMQTVQVTQTTATIGPAYQPYPQAVYSTTGYPPAVGQPMQTVANPNYSAPPQYSTIHQYPAPTPGYSAPPPGYSAPPRGYAAPATAPYTAPPPPPPQPNAQAGFPPKY